MIQTQYNEGGPIFTDDNDGKGYSQDEAASRAAAVTNTEKQ